MDRLDGVVRDAMRRTGVPGVAVGVVHDDEVLYLKGFGERKAGAEGQVGPDTVFQLVSVSRPVTSTVVAAAVGEKTVAWDDPVVEHSPGFALKDRRVTRQVTLADLFSHRSGLPDHAGDLHQPVARQRQVRGAASHRQRRTGRDPPAAPPRRSRLPSGVTSCSKIHR
ncbi:serine hydrolase domain-containing protein [Streptomyces dysideae]|uniref:serine hydrolase domain-containing protein n=1 Tax=Streptomyces dysideae TaxID=909626 RepID=UPI000A6C6BA0